MSVSTASAGSYMVNLHGASDYCAPPATSKKPTMAGPSVSPKRRRRLHQALHNPGAFPSAGEPARKARQGAEDKTIPILGRLHKTQSELQLQQDLAAAEWRDLAMFHRLVSGMQIQQQHQRAQTSSDLQRGSGPGGITVDPRRGGLVRTAPSPPQDAHAMQLTERCVERIISTRRREIPAGSMGVSLAEYVHADAFASASASASATARPRGAPSASALASASAVPRWPSTDPLAHMADAYGQYIDVGANHSAPLPTFPDLLVEVAPPPFLAAPATPRAQREAAPARVPSIVDPEDEDDAEDVFNLDL